MRYWYLLHIQTAKAVCSELKQKFKRKIAVFFLIYQFKHVSWVLKEPSHQDGSFEYPKHMF